MLLIKLLALVTLPNTNYYTNCRITLLVILYITSWWSLYLLQCPLAVPKLTLNCIYIGLANSLADSIINRSSGSQMFLKVSVLKNFSTFTGAHLWCWSVFLNKVSGLKACNFIKKKLQQGVLPRNWWNFQK